MARIRRVASGDPSRVKVLYVSHTGIVGGAEACLLDLLAALPSGVTPVLACPTGPLAECARDLAVRVRIIPAVSGGFRAGITRTPATLLQLTHGAWAIRRIATAEAPTVIHANTTRAGLICAAGVPRRLAPLVVHCHDVLPNTLAGRLAAGYLAHSARLVLVISEHVRQRWDGRPVQVEIVHNPLDTSRFDPNRLSRTEARAKLGLDANGLMMGVVAQLTPWKGQDTAIRTLAAVSEQFPRLNLLLVGTAKFTGPQTAFDNLNYEEELRQLSGSLGVASRVHFWGERADVEVVLRALDVALAPSWEEPFGRSVTEAAAVATPVIATNVGGPSEYLIDHLSGRLVDPHDDAGWTSAVIEILAHPDVARAMAERASVDVRARFSAAAYGDRIHGLYRDLVASVAP